MKICKDCGKAQGDYVYGGKLCQACYNRIERDKKRKSRGTPPENFRATAEERKFAMRTCLDCGETEDIIHSRCRKHYNEFDKRYKRRRRTKCSVCGLPREEGSRRVLCLQHRREAEAADKAARPPKKQRAPRLPKGPPVPKPKPAPPIKYVGERQAIVKKTVVVMIEEKTRPEPVKPKPGTKVVCVPYRDEEWEQRGKGWMEALSKWG